MSQYKKVLIIGATSGIGKALAERFIENGIFVIVNGRRSDRLEDFVQQHGQNMAEAAPFDITKLDAIEDFANKTTKQHPDIDCIIINAGIQRSHNFTEPNSVDMKTIIDEHTTNYLSPVALTKAFLPYLLAKNSPSSIVYTGSNLGLVPIPRCLNYCSSKAALHHFALCLREQIKNSNVKVVEILPPAVQTELHDAKHQPDLKNGSKMGMPLDEFTNEAWQGLCSDTTLIPVGQAKQSVDAIEPPREKIFRRMLDMMSKTQNS